MRDDIEALVKLNEYFHSHKMLPSSFYQQLMQTGFQFAKSVMIELVPDGSNTYFGKIIRQDGRVFEFDVDLDSSECSTLDDITDEFEMTLRNGKRRAKSDAIAAMDFFQKLQTK